MSYQIAVPYGDNLEALENGLRLLGASEVISVGPPVPDPEVAQKLRDYLSKKGIPFREVKTSSDSADSFFMALAALKSEFGDSLILNLSVGTTLYSHIMLCAAMASGVAAFLVSGGEVVFMPISCSISHGK
jgi:hypothetical protein